MFVGFYNRISRTQLMMDIFMAVYTKVSFSEASSLLADLGLGKLQSMEGCSGGIENTNYFVSTNQSDYVLTLFERLTAQQLPFYLRLMKHLANHGIPVPNPAADAHGEILHSLQGKPAAVVNRLRGKSELAPTPQHCTLVGDMLARMHLAGQGFEMHQTHLRGLEWWNKTANLVLPYLNSEQSQLLTHELSYQNEIANHQDYRALPKGPIHADLFRDNVMFELKDTSDAGEPQLTGFFDFYFAGIDVWLFDIAVCLNDWCIDLSTCSTNFERTAAFMNAYNAVRPLQAEEQTLLPALLRAGALRFWISRLWDWHLPREASMLKPHDPTHFERVLQHRILSNQRDTP